MNQGSSRDEKIAAKYIKKKLQNQVNHGEAQQIKLMTSEAPVFGDENDEVKIEARHSLAKQKSSNLSPTGQTTNQQSKGRKSFRPKQLNTELLQNRT